ncbi:lipocalin family protein [Pedobacter sp. Leaf132]|uniref:lipocalin family protein n=1 Tax=Pedobacter sp. Leaf132 TaxID=2876557 RepID=UPI001E2B12B1|nr:lipocalin family protein [Pedobacter sp. Leaf132]
MRLNTYKVFLLLAISIPALFAFSILENQHKEDLKNQPIAKIDFNKFQGKWYSLTSIPTFLDKKWRKTIENYTLKDNRFDVFTTYYKQGEAEEQSIKSKLFFYSDEPDGKMKAQFFWPIKVGYWVIELPQDYSYLVVGHPDKKYLFIMSRKPNLDKNLMQQIVERCKNKGYDVSKLVSQEHE